jgi:hypothetical protein
MLLRGYLLLVVPRTKRYRAVRTTRLRLVMGFATVALANRSGSHDSQYAGTERALSRLADESANH